MNQYVIMLCYISHLFTGCFNLHCIRKKLHVKNDHVEEEDDHVKEEDQLVEEECPVKNDLLDLSWEDLRLFTRQFSSENLIGLTQFGELYRGKMFIGSDQDKIYQGCRCQDYGW